MPQILQAGVWCRPLLTARFPIEPSGSQPLAGRLQLSHLAAVSTPAGGAQSDATLRTLLEAMQGEVLLAERGGHDGADAPGRCGHRQGGARLSREAHGRGERLAGRDPRPEDRAGARGHPPAVGRAVAASSSGCAAPPNHIMAPSHHCNSPLDSSGATRISPPTVSGRVHASRHRAVVDEAGNSSRRSRREVAVTPARAPSRASDSVPSRSGRR